jgi:excisionase family DNA binding protein
MKEFSIHMELDRSGDMPDEHLDNLIELGEKFAAAWGTSTTGNLDVQFNLPAENLRQAADIAFAVIPDLVERAGLGRPAPLTFEALPYEQFVREQEQPTIPPLVGVGEAAVILNVSEQAVRQAAEKGRFGAFRIGKSWAFPRSLVKAS